MAHHQRNRTVLGYQLAYHLGCVTFARARIHQQRSVFAEDEVEEWLLVMRAAGFAEYEEVLVVSVNLPGRHLQAIRTACHPRTGQFARFNILSETNRYKSKKKT